MATKKAALGRGLDALIPTKTSNQDVDISIGDVPSSKMYDFEDRRRLVGRVADVETDNIKSNPFQPRATFDEVGLEELAASIKQLGIIQPITVRALDGGQFELISGERRLRAARKAGLRRIPAYVRQADTEEILEMAIVENIQREELNPIEVALGYQRLMDECGLTQEQVADKVGKSRVAVSNMIRLLKLPPFVQSALKVGSITTGHARALINVENEDDQRTILEKILRDGLSVRDVERQVRRLVEGPPASSRSRTKVKSDEDPHVSALADRLRTRFSTQVQIRSTPGKDGGRIEISFYSKEDLERLIEMLVD